MEEKRRTKNDKLLSFCSVFHCFCKKTSLPLQEKTTTFLLYNLLKRITIMNFVTNDKLVIVGAAGMIGSNMA
ncbi:MAG: hypothetical protein SOZ18_06090, partial [Phocaeicola sp.]|nr:hypothetical protein [Phocaeicola sp.]